MKSHGKKLVSLLLAVLMVLSSLTVGFAAFAADETEQPSKSAPVVAVETAIKDFYDKGYSSKMFSTKAEEAEIKATALKAFEDICASISKLTDAQKVELDVSNYVFMIARAADKVGRDAGKTSTDAQVYGANEGFAEVTKLMGKLPADYQKAYDMLKATYKEVDGTFFDSYFDFAAHPAGNAVFENVVSTLKALTPNAMKFINLTYCNTYGTKGFYFYCSSPTTTTGYFMGDVADWMVNYEQDKISGEKAPSSPSYSTYMNRKYVSSGVYDYSWKTNNATGQQYSAADYKADFDAFYPEYVKRVDAPGLTAVNNLIDIIGAVAGSDDANAIKAVVNLGIQVMKGESVSSSQVVTALENYGKISEFANSLLGDFLYIKVASTVSYPDVAYDKNMTPEQLYNNQADFTYKYAKDMKKVLEDVLSQLQLDECVAAIEEADVASLTQEEAAEIAAKYAILTSEFKNKLTTEQYSKLLKIATIPFENKDNFEEFVAGFETTPVDREAIGGDVIWTEGGVQSAIDGLWNMVTDTEEGLGSILGLVGVDLSNGVEGIVAGALYTPETIAAIFDLYAMLSHDQTDTGVSVIPTLGAAIEMILGGVVTDSFKDYENRFTGAAEKFAAVTDPTTEEKAEGVTKFDKYAAAAHTFTAEDLGLDGTQDAFVDALLAALRPISALVSEEKNFLLGMAGINMQLYDKVNDDGTLSVGIYSKLIPLLEQLGIEAPTAVDFRENYFKTKAEKDQNAAYDEILGTIIRPLFSDIVNPILADPLNGLVKVLPRLAYVIDSDMINNIVGDILANLGGPVADLAGSLDLSKEAINAMIPSEIDLSGLLGVDVTLNIPAIDWAKFANCATVEVRESASNGNAYYVLRTGDTDSCFTEVFGLLYDVIADEALIPVLKDALKGMLGKNYDMMLEAATDGKLTIAKVENWVKIGKTAAYADFLGTFGEPTGADLHPVAPPTDGPNGGGNGDKPVAPVNPNEKTPTKNPNIPNTGVETAVATGVAYTVAIALVGLAVVMLVAKRKVTE